MPFVAGKHLDTFEDLEETDIEHLSKGVMYLAEHLLVYTDLRPQNVIKSKKALYLVDYDDALLVKTAAEAIQKLVELSDCQDQVASSIWKQAIRLLETSPSRVRKREGSLLVAPEPKRANHFVKNPT